MRKGSAGPIPVRKTSHALQPRLKYLARRRKISALGYQTTLHYPLLKYPTVWGFELCFFPPKVILSNKSVVWKGLQRSASMSVMLTKFESKSSRVKGALVCFEFPPSARD